MEHEHNWRQLVDDEGVPERIQISGWVRPTGRYEYGMVFFCTHCLTLKVLPDKVVMGVVENYKQKEKRDEETIRSTVGQDKTD